MLEKTLNRNSLRVLGAMSGTSADGIDFALTELSGDGVVMQHRVLAAETVSYSNLWLNQLREAEQCSAVRLAELHALYGKHTGEAARDFLQRFGLQADVLSMHGHTLFHQPGRGFTFQLGSGAAAAAAAGLITVSDFRSTDVAYGGQGAPLVPLGDRLLFSEADACLNLGGFANVSYETPNGRIAFDICAVNYVLNRLAQRLGKAYDESGHLAQKGTLLAPLLEQLERLPWYTLPAPKSLGREWVEAEIFPLLTENFTPEDLLHTFTEHTAIRLSEVCKTKGTVLITGGGTHNSYLLERCRHYGFTNQLIPNRQTIDFKEAVVFALLGWLRLQQLPNALGSVTGALSNSSGGAVYLP
jgi:anhydro-N-acetylmuramic acid kinase